MRLRVCVAVSVMLFSMGWAEDVVRYPPLFASVTGVAENDTLNVRAKPDYRSRKRASLPDGAYVGVDRCRQKGDSVWCLIHHIAQHDYEGYGWNAPEGWVNARYLKFGNRGYVLIDGKARCDYVTGCQNGVCNRVADYTLNKAYEILSVKMEKIARSRLKGESHFGAMDPEGDGYCTHGNRVNAYLVRRNIQTLSGFSDDPGYQKALRFIQAYTPERPEEWSRYIHPERGVRVGYETCFSKGDRVVFPPVIEQMEKERHQTYVWGTAVNDEKVVMSLYALFKWMEPDLGHLKEVQILPSLRGFPCPQGSKCKGYVFYSYEKPRESDFSWQGMVVIMEKRGDKWYVAGLLHDRWTI